MSEYSEYKTTPNIRPGLTNQEDQASKEKKLACLINNATFTNDGEEAGNSGLRETSREEADSPEREHVKRCAAVACAAVFLLFVAIFVLWIASFSSAVLLGVTASVIVTLRDARSDFLLIITSGIIIGFVVGIHVGSEIYNEWLESETRI